MRTIRYIIGAAAGFWLTELALALRPPKSGNEKVMAATHAPALDKTQSTAGSAVAEATGALLGKAKDRIAPLALAVGLNDTQYQAMLEIAVEHSRKWQELRRQPGSARKREEYSAEFSRTAEARLAARLTPDQLEQVARLNRSAIPFAAMVDGFAVRGAPLAREHAHRLLVPGTDRMPEGSFVALNPTEPDPSAPWMTDAQRRYAAARQRWLAAGELIDAVNSTKVKGP